MRIPRVVAAVAVPALLLAACDGDEEPGSDEPAGPDQPGDLDDPDDAEAPTETVEREPAEVELVDRGTEPRERLRLELEEGTAATGTLGFEEEVLSGGADDEPGPPQSGVIDLALEVTEVTDDRATIAFVYEDVAIDGQGAGRGDPLEGAEGEMVLDDRSRLVSTTQGAQGLDQLPIALPDEEVGVGAVWEVRTEDVFELPATEIMTVELTALDGDEYEIELTASTEGPSEPTPIPGGGMQPDAELLLEELDRDSSGRQRASQSSPLPISSQLTTRTLLVVSLEQEADDPAADLGGEQRQEFREEIVFDRD